MLHNIVQRYDNQILADTSLNTIDFTIKIITNSFFVKPGMTQTTTRNFPIKITQKY